MAAAAAAVVLVRPAEPDRSRRSTSSIPASSPAPPVTSEHHSARSTSIVPLSAAEDGAGAGGGGTHRGPVPVRAHDADLVADLPPESRAQFKARVRAHQRRLKLLALVVVLCAAPGVLYMAVTQNYSAEVYLSRGGDPARAAASHEVTRALEGSSALLVRALLYGVSAVFTTGWTPAWLWRLARTCGAQPPRGFLAGSALVVAGGFTILVTEALLHIETATRLLGFIYVTGAYMVLSHFVGLRVGLPAMGRIVGMLYIVSAAVLIVYLVFVPPWFFNASEETRIAVRLVAHPLMLEASLVLVRYLGRRLPCADTAPVVEFAFVNYLSMNIIGRVLLFSMRTAWAQTVTVVGLSVIEVWLRVSTLDRDRLYYRLLFGGRRGALLAKTPRAQAIKAECVGADQVCEDAGILLGALITVLYRTSADVGAPPAVADVLLSAALQWLAELVTDAVPAMFVLAASPEFTDSPPRADGKPLSWLERRAIATHRNVARTLQVWEGRGPLSREGLFFGFTAFAWATYAARQFFSPFEFMCTAGAPYEAMGVQWQHWVECTLTAGAAD